jgi:hypothetical protein
MCLYLLNQILMYEIDNYLEDINKSDNKFLCKPIYFYNGLNHNDLCLYTDQNIKNVLDYLKKKFNMNIKYLLWKEIYNNVYINELTSIVKFINLNDKKSFDILLKMLDEKKNYLSEKSLIMSELVKEYNELK